MNGHSNGQRPASKARRTSSGGSRVPSEDIGQSSGGQGSSSASDSGLDWPHAPKTHNTMRAASPAHTINSSTQQSDEKVAGKRPEEASTSSNYFSGAVSASSSSSPSTRQDRDGLEGRSPRMDLAKYPPQDLLRVLAALLAQIASANDQLRPKNGSSTAATTPDEGRQRRKEQINSGHDTSLARSSSGGSVSSGLRAQGDDLNAAKRPSASSSPNRYSRPTTAAMSALQTPSSTLCFHARNVPSISIESYLLRILKYCPATNEVFLSLLIYFDRMSKMGSSSSAPSRPASTTSALDMAGRGEKVEAPVSSTLAAPVASSAAGSEEEGEGSAYIGMRGFAIDSYNVHRLVIAGVTVASKFFSDVFYTNSRYAKVGGLPVHELNQLELQFLLLNDFRLVIPLEEMQRYADQLLVYGGVSEPAWSEQQDGAKRSPASNSVTGQHTDHSTNETISRHEDKDESMKEA